MSNNAHELSNRLLNALDNNYNVVDMHAVNEIISILEKINITKELLETTRLGKHVNELRRKTSEPTLARRAKVLVKRWRDLVIPAAASPGHTGSNRSSAERQMRRLGGTPITSPAFARQVVSPAVPSPRPPSRPAWGGYESDSQDVILVDDDPPAPALPAPSPLAFTPTHTHTHKHIASPAKRPPSPEAPIDEKKAKRDKKPKKRRGHSRAGSGTEAVSGPDGAAPGSGLAPGSGTAPGPGSGLSPAPGAWSGRNGAQHPHIQPGKKNGLRNALDPYAALVNRMPPAGAKKVKTTQELLAQIQSRGQPPRSPLSADRADSPVLIVENDDELSPVRPSSPLRNGGASPLVPARAPASPPAPLPPLEDPREYADCTCDEEPDDSCPAATQTQVLPVHVHALHHAYLPGVNGTRAPLHPHQFAVRKLADLDTPDLFASVVPLYNYSDYADDYCVKNLSRVPLCTHLPWTEFAPEPPELEPAPEPPPVRPYPVDDQIKQEVKDEDGSSMEVDEIEPSDVRAEAITEPEAPETRVKTEPEVPVDETLKVIKCASDSVVPDEFASEQSEHRTVERTKDNIDGAALVALCRAARGALGVDYSQAGRAPTVTLPAPDEAERALEAALHEAAEATTRDPRGRPERTGAFAEWHECARLGELVALPYVVID